jgi:hypothetical protein
MSEVKGDESISDRMTSIILRGCCYDIIVLNIQASTEDKIDYVRTASKRTQNVFSLVIQFMSKSPLILTGQEAS